MMHIISMILDPDACVYDAGLFPDGPKDKANSRSWIVMTAEEGEC